MLGMAAGRADAMMAAERMAKIWNCILMVVGAWSLGVVRVSWVFGGGGGEVFVEEDCVVG